MSSSPLPFHQGKIIVAIALSFAISVFLMQAVFVDKTTHPHLNVLQQKADELRSSVADFGFRMTAKLAGLNMSPMAPTVAPVPLPVPHSQAGLAMDTLPAPTGIPQPTAASKPTTPADPTTAPVLPTGTTKLTVIPPQHPTAIPKPQPTTAPAPLPLADVPVFDNPLSQPWYGRKSGLCYAPSRFIQVYAKGVAPDTCRKNVKAAVESQLTTLKLLGRTITVHKKAAPAFQAVSSALEAYKKDATHYDFPGKKNYAIRNVGAYVFRCNVNASTSGKFDTCSSGCVISPHSYGIAVDINYDTNANGSTSYDMPKEIVDTFEHYGFRWGGRYPKLGSTIDPMHFEYMVQLCEGV